VSQTKGCSFLTENAAPAEVFTPEDFTEEHLMIRDLARQFVTEEVLPRRRAWSVRGTPFIYGNGAATGVDWKYRWVWGENLDKVSAMIG
jgi:hypothetical protein